MDKVKEEIKTTKEKIEQKRWYEKMSKFEKIFWVTIIILFIIYIFFNILAFKNIPVQNNDRDNTIIGSYVEKFVPTDKVKNNLSENENRINKHLNIELETIYSQIDREVDYVFSPIENNVDHFLNFHYSVIGEYTELGTLALGDIEVMIRDKVFGSDFEKKLENTSENINTQYKSSIDNHLLKIKEIALEDIDIDINTDSLARLEHDIQTNKLIQFEKAGLLVAARIGPKIASKASAKLARTIVVKASAKGATKLATKSATATTAVTAGALCGPFVWICSPVAAGVAWVATDIAFVSGDEYFNRDEFKNEILASVRNNKKLLKNQYKDIYYKSYQKLSSETKKFYKEASIVERKRVKDKF